MCPRCRQNAPIVYRGVNAFCTACGAPRSVLAGSSVNLAGQPSKVGGTITRVFGWIVLVIGTLLALGTFAACSAIAGGPVAAAYVLSVPLALVSWVLAYFLLKGGRQLEQSGADAQKATRAAAVFALANTRAGMITPMDLAHAINVTPKEADDVLTAMAKESPDHVSIEVDDNGTIFYRFSAAHWSAIAGHLDATERQWARARVGDMAPNAVPAVAGPRVPTSVAPNVRVDPRDPIEDELAPDAHAQRRAR